jgi:hypothetical protein
MNNRPTFGTLLESRSTDLIDDNDINLKNLIYLIGCDSSSYLDCLLYSRR